MKSTPVKINTIRFQDLIVILSTLTLLVIGKDLMHSSLQNYSFYLSESLLFGAFWMIFIPLILINKQKSFKKFNLILPFAFSLFHLVFFSLFVFFISSLFLNHTFEFYRTFLDTTAKYGIVCLLIYGIYSFLFLGNPTPLSDIQQLKVSEKIKVAYQNKVVILDCKDILYVKSEKPYIALVTKERSYLLQSTLKKFLEEKATKNFMQIHKSTIVNTDFIVSYVSRKNGDYDVQLSNKHLVRASRSFNSTFKLFIDSISLA